MPIHISILLFMVGHNIFPTIWYMTEFAKTRMFNCEDSYLNEMWLFFFFNRRHIAVAVTRIFTCVCTWVIRFTNPGTSSICRRLILVLIRMWEMPD